MWADNIDAANRSGSVVEPFEDSRVSRSGFRVRVFSLMAAKQFFWRDGPRPLLGANSQNPQASLV